MPGGIGRAWALVLAGLLSVHCTGGDGDDDGGDDTSDGDASDDGPNEPIQMCGIADIVLSDPGMVDAGMTATQIPPDIGDTIARNCGCHFGTDLIEGAMPNPQSLATLADWQDNTAKILGRVDLEVGLTMPPSVPCSVDNGGGDNANITDHDKMRLVGWLQAGTPDGATWMPPPPPPE